MPWVLLVISSEFSVRWLKSQSAKAEKSVDPNATKIIKQETSLVTHAWTSSFLFVSQLSGTLMVSPSFFFYLCSSPWSPEGIKFKRATSAIHKISFPCPYFFWTAIFFLPCFFFFPISLSTISIPSTTRSEVRREGTAVGEILVAGTHTITIAVSAVFAVWGSKVLCEHEVHLWPAGVETTSEVKKKVSCKGLVFTKPFCK